MEDMPQNPKTIFYNVEKNNLKTPTTSNKCNSFIKAWIMSKLGNTFPTCTLKLIEVWHKSNDGLTYNLYY